MKKPITFLAFLTLLCAIVAPRATFAQTPVTTIEINTTVDTPDDGLSIKCSTASDGQCNLRRAMVEVENLDQSERPVAVVFNIPTSDPHYDATLGVWMLQIEGALQSVEPVGYVIDPNLGLTMDGDTQPGGRALAEGPRIFIDTNASDLQIGGYSLELLGANNTIANLGFIGGGTLTLKGTAGRYERGANNIIDGIWMGLSPDGMSLSLSTEDDKAKLARGGINLTFVENNILRNSYVIGAYGIGINVQGRDNVIRDNFVGTRSDGTVPVVDPAIKCESIELQDGNPTYNPDNWYGGWGLQITESGNKILNNTIAGLYNVESAFATKPIALDVTGVDVEIKDNKIGIDGADNKIGTCGPAMNISGSQIAILDNEMYDVGVFPDSDGSTISSAIIVGDISDFIAGNQNETTTTDWIMMRRNILTDDTSEDADDDNPLYLQNFATPSGNPANPDYFNMKRFDPGQITAINGTTVIGTNGYDPILDETSLCPNCLVDLYLDNLDAQAEAYAYLGTATADENGDFTFELAATLPDDRGIRTVSTPQNGDVIPGFAPKMSTAISKDVYTGSAPLSVSVDSISTLSTKMLQTNVTVTFLLFAATVSILSQTFLSKTGQKE